MMAPELEADRTNLATFLFITSIVLLIILIYPWIFGISIFCFLLGYSLLDNISEYFEKLICQNFEAVKSSNQPFKMDPLLHPEPLNKNNLCTTSRSPSHYSNEHHVSSKQSGPAVICTVCDAENCPRSAGNESNSSRTTSTAHYGKGSHDLRIDPALDKSLAKFCTTIFDFYISSDWAPYETRKQLRLAFKSLLTNFGETLEFHLGKDEKATKFCEDKIIPLCFHYLDRIWNNYSHQRNSLKLGSDDICDLEKISNLKLRRLCRKLLEKNLPSQHQKCRLWIELCVAVLGDGVLWNLILLGRKKLPKLFLEYCNNYKSLIELSASNNEPWSRSLNQNNLVFLSTQASVCGKNILESLVGSRQSFLDYTDKLRLQLMTPKINPSSSEILNNVASNLVETQTPELVFTFSNNGNGIGTNNTYVNNNVPLLLDSFLDPVNDLYQPDSISSRWRPTLLEILTERDLLYCLIQYLKGHKALEYLQAVLDESPDGNAYCKKVLQLEYLPGFCRSRFFMESLGVSQVDCALEAGNDSPGSKRRMGHTRSSSSGNVNSGIQIWKIGDPKAVDGLPLHTTSIAAAISSGSIESEFSFRRRQYSPEGIISKFIMSTGRVNEAYKKDENLSKERKPPPTRRVGIDAKSYYDLIAEDVLSEVLVSPCDIFDCATQIAASLHNRQLWIQPVLNGWSQLLRPYLKPRFDQLVKSQLNQFLTIDTCVYLIDLITQAFIDNSSASTPDTSAAGTSASGPGTEENLKSGNDDPNHATRQNLENESVSKIEAPVFKFGHWLLSQFVDPVEFALALQSNEDEIILFFIDLVDLIVKQVTEES